jgi:hypothetical protein
MYCRLKRSAKNAEKKYINSTLGKLVLSPQEKCQSALARFLSL